MEFAVSLVVRLAPAFQEGNLVLHRIAQRHVFREVNGQDMRRKVYLLIQLVAGCDSVVLMLPAEFRVRKGGRIDGVGGGYGEDKPPREVGKALPLKVDEPCRKLRFRRRDAVLLSDG